jgi:hypothetical protein
VVEGARHSNGIIAAVSAETMQLAREGLEACRRGDFEAVKSMLEPSATWRWFEPGEWDCENRDDIMGTLRERHAQGFAKGDLEFIDRGSERVIVVSYPSRIGGEEWPDETATVLSFHNGKVVDMQDYRTRDDAIAATD